MRRFLLPLCLALVFYGHAQNLNYINPITINLPTRPPANTELWGSGTSPFVIVTKSTRADVEGRVLVTVKKGGSIVCGSYTPITAPQVEYGPPGVKTWSGVAANALLGTNCILPGGDYELCVQFYGKQGMPLLGESCKPFSIATTPVNNSYQPPQNILPADGAIIKEGDARKPITFRWVPVVPKPQGNVVYRLKVWQLMQGQNANAAVKANTPVIEKEITNATQAQLNLSEWKCSEPCEFVWNVEAMDKENGQGNKSLGTSAPSAFKIIIEQPGGCFELDTSQYKVSCYGINSSGQYVFKVTNLLINNIYTNPGNCTANSGTSLTSMANYVNLQSPSAVLSVANITPATIPVIAASSPQSFSFDIISSTQNPGTVALNLAFYGQCNGPAGISKCATLIPVVFDSLPSCRCTTCDNVKIKLDAPVKGQQGDNITLKQQISTLSIPGNTALPIKSLTAELVYFEVQKNDSLCYRCDKDNSHFGKIVKVAMPATGFSNASQLPSGDVVFNAASPIALSNAPLDIEISAPELNKCCTDNIKVCIRYTVVLADCRSCSVAECYELGRKK